MLQPDDHDLGVGAAGTLGRARGEVLPAHEWCLARCRVDVLHAMLRTKTPYQPKPADEPRLAA